MNERDTELLDLAHVYALDAVDDTDRREIDNAVASASREARAEFADTVRSTREIMATQSVTTAIDPPSGVLDRIMESLPQGSTPRDEVDTSEPISLAHERARRRTRILATVGAAAAVVVVAFGGAAVSQQFRSTPTEPTTAQILAADDVRTSTTAIGTGGSATFVYSKDMNAGMLVMNDVAPPDPGSVYQMWLLGSGNPESVGIMEQSDIGPSTTAVVEDLDQATKLGFTVEPPGGSPQPTSDPFAAIELA